MAKTTSKILMAAAVALTALTVLAGPAAAQASYPGGSVTVSTSTAAPGGTITVSASGFQPGSTVTFTIESTPQTLGTATADSSGTATLTATIPAGIEAGPHTIRATGIAPDGSPLEVTTTITVSGAAESAGGGSGLAETGTSSGVLLRVGALVVVLGGILLVASRRSGAARQTESV